MFPIVLDLTLIPVLLIGQGTLLEKRLKQLQDAGAEKVTVMDNSLPQTSDIEKHSIIMVAGLARDPSADIAEQARAAGKLVNVEDVNDLCDFYFTANVRRGDLIIAISTTGASPTLARKIRDTIGAMFGEEWAARVSEIAARRKAWKAQGLGFQKLIDHSEAFLVEKKWFSS